MFVPGIPIGSEIRAADFKAAVCGLGDLPNRIAAARQNPWSFEQWRRFAEYHRFERVENAAAAWSERVYAAEKLLDAYGVAFRKTYAASGTVDISCLDAGQALSSIKVAERVVSGESTLLLGPSGCGKSVLAQQIGAAALDADVVPILLQVRDFAGRLKDALDHEVSLLDVPGARDLLQAALLLGRRLLLIVDGYNECDLTRQEVLTRCMLAFARRYLGQLLVTSQLKPVKGELLTLWEVAVPEPNLALKTAVAAQAAGGQLRAGVETLLASVSSCLEARLVGEAGLAIAADASRYALFDAYVRNRLDQDACEGIRMLAKLAGEMARRLTFSLTVRERDRLVEGEPERAALLRALERSNALVRRGDRLSFRHELFFHAFSAEAVVRAAQGQPAAILAALGRPLFAESRTLILGAIDDHALIREVLTGTGNQALLLACWAGECGVNARNLIRQQVTDLIPLLREEIRGAVCAIGEGWDSVGFDPVSLHRWTEHERALLVVLSHALFHGEHLDSVFELAEAMDQKIQEGVDRFRGDPRLRKGQSIRSTLFANAFLFADDRNPGLATVSAMGRSGGLWPDLRHPVPPSERLLHWLRKDWLSHGQKYLLLHLFQGMQLPAATYVDALCAWLPSVKTYPQHLAAEMLHQTVFCGQVEEPARSLLIHTLMELLPSLGPWTNDSVFEALERLGALDEEAQAHLVDVREQIQVILADRDNPQSWADAFRIHGSCMDHPYSAAYIEAVEELPEADKKELIRQACLGAPEQTYDVTMLIWDVAHQNDPVLVPVVARWSGLPLLDTPLQQDAVQAFVGVNTLLGRYNLERPAWDTSGDSDAAVAMRACGTLYYWISRNDVAGAAGFASATDAAWKVLLDHEAGTAAYALYHCERHARYGDKLGSGPIPYICERFPDQAAEVCRQALHSADRQKDYYPHNHGVRDMLRFCVDMLGLYGHASDVDFLRAMSDIDHLGRSAIEAIRRLEP